eukprot:2274370-Amphidinium_carterae.1
MKSMILPLDSQTRRNLTLAQKFKTTRSPFRSLPGKTSKCSCDLFFDNSRSCDDENLHESTKHAAAIAMNSLFRMWGVE